MRLSNLILALTLCAFGLATAQETDPPVGTEKTQQQQDSYAVGQQIGLNLADTGYPVDFDELIRGIGDALKGKRELNDEQLQEALNRFQQAVQALQQSKADEKGKENLEKGAAFLAENKQKEGVIETESGLQYQVLTAGEGAIPAASDRVRVHYRGTLVDGTEFDSSYSRGEPAVFGVTRVIQGWVEALQLMKVGSKWKLFIPGKLAYGTNPPPGGPIAPNSVLVFEVELLGIEGS